MWQIRKFCNVIKNFGLRIIGLVVPHTKPLIKYLIRFSFTILLCLFIATTINPFVPQIKYLLLYKLEISESLGWILIIAPILFLEEFIRKYVINMDPKLAFWISLIILLKLLTQNREQIKDYYDIKRHNYNLEKIV